MTQALLFSGGMDSTALAWMLRPEHAITIDYGQRPAEGEIRAARVIAGELGIRHHLLRIDCSPLGSGDLVGMPPLGIAPVREWWPFRNQLLITLAAAALIPFEVKTLLLGAVRGDEVHFDGSAEFVRLADDLVSAQEGRMRVAAPAIGWDEDELIARSGVPLSLLAWSHSCHTAAVACGNCRGCAKQERSFRRLQVPGY